MLPVVCCLVNVCVFTLCQPYLEEPIFTEFNVVFIILFWNIQASVHNWQEPKLFSVQIKAKFCPLLYTNSFDKSSWNSIGSNYFYGSDFIVQLIYKTYFALNVNFLSRVQTIIYLVSNDCNSFVTNICLYRSTSK